jgi:hypothetical protein
MGRDPTLPGLTGRAPAGVRLTGVYGTFFSFGFFVAAFSGFLLSTSLIAASFF